MRIRATVIAAVIAAIATIVVGLFLLEETLVSRGQKAQVLADMEIAHQQVAIDLRRGDDPDIAADRVGALHAAHVVITQDGYVVGDTATNAPLFGRSERGTHTARRLGEVGIFGVTQREQVDDWEVVVSRPRPRRNATTRRENVLVVSILAAAAALLLILVLSRTLISPIERLTKTANKLAKGDFSARNGIRRADEIGALGQAMDRMAQDLEQRMSANQAEDDRLQTMLDAMVEGVFVTDPNGAVILTNAALDELVQQEALGRTVVEVFRSEALREAVSEAQKGSPRIVEFTPEGEQRRDIAAHIAPLREQRGVVAVLHDVSALRNTDRIRRDFVANASHELRTPLTAIRGYTETLIDGALSDPSSAERFLKTIFNHTRRLQRLVDDLLALSRAESPDSQFELSSVVLQSVISEVVEGLEGQARVKRIAVRIETTDVNLVVMANEAALDQVLINLVDNAVKYTPEDGDVVVSALIEEEFVCIDVSDSGPGLEPKHRERIFERFYRIDKGRSRETGGTGLGLAIVKHLCERMGGSVSVTESEPPGTTFRVTLPIVSVSGRTTQALHEPPQ